MATTVKSMAVVAASGIAAMAVMGIPVAEADPGCNVLWGDYCNTQNQPPAAPTISWDQGLGTLTAHITDRSGVASQCTYSSDLVNRSFSLPAKSTFDLVIAPAVPAFRNWDVTVACDNGAVANTSKFF